MGKPRVLIPLFPGTNCHREMARAFELAGADPLIVTITDLFRKKVRLYQTDLIGLAGGFSYGDHFRSGAFAANDLLNQLREDLELVKSKRIPILGVCNGFQILVETGLLPGNQEIGKPSCVLDLNSSGRFEHWLNRKVSFRVPPSGCVWLNGLDGMTMTLPVANSEGLLKSKKLDFIEAATYPGDPADSPSGSCVAGICSPDGGAVFGLMPHPERRADSLYGGDQGLAIFQSGVQAVL